MPLDRYVLPVPAGQTFLAWIATPVCIAWDQLITHLALLASGVPCYSPRPAWERDWREWVCAGGALAGGAGRRMEPAAAGYLLAGTHAFACPPQTLPTLRVFVRTPLVVVAERITGRRADRRAARALVRARLSPNTAALLRERRWADVIIDGTADRPAQVRRFLDVHAARFWRGTAPIPESVGAAERGVAADVGVAEAAAEPPRWLTFPRS